MALAAIALLVFPIVLGPIAITLAAVAMARDEDRSVLALVIALVATAIGIVMGMIVGGLVWG